MHRDADAAPHHDAVEQRDVRLRVALDDAIERILFAPVNQRIALTAGLAEIVNLAQVASGGECTPARTSYNDTGNGGIVAPQIELFAQRTHHDKSYSIKRLRTVEG